MPRKQKPAIPRKHNGYWYLIRRVPLRYAKHDPRKAVSISTRIAVADDPNGARAAEAVAQLDRKVYGTWRLMELHWAQRTARHYGFAYLEWSQLKSLPRSELLARLYALEALPEDERNTVALALLGIVEVAQLETLLDVLSTTAAASVLPVSG